MPIDVLMPQLSPTMSEGRLAKWTVNEGDEVAAGDIIAEVETDKATMEVEATDDGIIHQIIGKVGTDIRVGVPIAVMKEDGEDVSSDYQPTSREIVEEVFAADSGSDSEENTTTSVSTSTSTVAVTKKINLAPELPVIHPKGDDRVIASPVAKRMAEQQGVDLSKIQGSGPNGRIVKEDIEQAMLGSGNRVTRKSDAKLPHTPMRKAIASRLTESKQEIPHFYVTASVNMDTLMEARKQLNTLADGKYKLTVNDFIIKACALGLQKNPEANASWYDDAMVHYGNVDISVAVATEGGLITPIVKNADQKSLVKISTEMKSLAKQAREGSLKPGQYQGGGFSISNLGMYGVKEFKAIVNPPQAAIIAVGGSEQRAVVKDGQVSVANIMDVSISVDHRAIDGALAAELLRDIKMFLENPILLVG